MKRIILLILLCTTLISLSQIRQRFSPAIFRVEHIEQTIVFKQTDSTQTVVPCQSVASIVANANPSKIVSLWVVRQDESEKILQFDYSVCGFSSKQDAVDSLTSWSNCSGSSGGISQSTLDDSLAAIRNYIENNTYIQTDSSTITDYVVLASQNAPPVSPTTGDTYLVGNSPSGAWVGHAKDIAEWNGSSWDFTDAVQGNYLYNTANALTYIFRSGSWVQTTGIPALHNGNTISLGLQIGTNNAKSLTFETNNTNRGRIDSIGRFHVYNLPASTDTFVAVTDVVGKFGKIGKSSFLSGVGGGGSNLKIRYDIDSIRMWNESTTDTVVLGYALRSVALNAGGDSLVFYQANTRTALFIGGGSGGAELSAITAATATNTIDNKAYQQTWKWDSLSSGTGMKISTASTLASGNTQTLFEIEQTGTNATSSLKTYATKIKSTKSSNSNSNVALYLEASGVSSGGASNSRALEIGGGEIYINTGGTTNPYFRFASGAYWFDNTVGLQQFNAPAGTNTGFSFAPNSVYGINFQNHFSGTAGFGFSNYSSTRNAMLFGAQGYFASYYAQQASAVVLERDKDVFSISADSATGSTFFTPTKILSVRGKTTNVGIGTQLPDASAILDLTSTTKGFLPPRMTSTQGSALTPIEGLLIYVTDTNGTFTSKGWWGYNGSAWEKLNN